VRVLAVLLIAALGLTAFAVKLLFAPLHGSEEWITCHILLICAGAVVGFLIWNWFFPSRPGCNLSLSLQPETDEHGNCRGEKGSCLSHSVGLVEIKEARCSDGEYISTGRRYFCRVHDPRHTWMRDWLEVHKIQIVPGKIKKLRFVDENP
jgi:hypothetical protein